MLASEVSVHIWSRLCCDLMTVLITLVSEWKWESDMRHLRDEVLSQ